MGNDLFDTFTERASKVLTLAQEEAVRLNHSYIGTEHLLLGLVRDEGVAANVLISMGVKLNGVRNAVEFIIGRGDDPIAGEIGLTPRAKKVIELAVDEARRLGHHYIGTEHLLLGLVREGEGIGAGVMEALGVTLEWVRTQTVLVLYQGFADASDPGTPQPAAAASALASRPLNYFAREALLLAKDYARELRSEMIEPEHVLMGLIAADSGKARAILDALGVDVPALKGRLVRSPGQRQADLVDAWLTGKAAEVEEPSGLSPAARNIVERSVEEADRLGDGQTDSVHLLLAILHNAEGAPSQYLAEYDVTLDRARAFLFGAA